MQNFEKNFTFRSGIKGALDILHKYFLIILIVNDNKFNNCLENFLSHSAWKFDFIFKIDESNEKNIVDYNFIFKNLGIEELKIIIIANALEF